MLKPSKSNHAINTIPALAALVATFLPAQTASPKPESASGSPIYLIQSSVPPQARPFLVALGDRLQKPGKERLVLTGQYSDKSGNVPAQLTWEAPGNIRLDRNGPGLPSLVFNTAAGVVNASALSAADLDIFESLLDDRPETFLYSFYNGSANRFLGNKFRTDDGKTPNYIGPWYDIFQGNGPVLAKGKTVARSKMFCFDSQTHLLTQTVYKVFATTPATTVLTTYSGWSVQNGEAVPGQILRSVNGTVEFTFKVNASTVGPAAQDGIFSKP
jgi:hypothetical protein